MEHIDIKNYLYHGIQGVNSDKGSMYILESILKTGYIVNASKGKEYNINSCCNIYAENGFSPRISLGFYPLDQATYELSKDKFPDFYGFNIVEKILKENNISYEEAFDFVDNCYNLNKNHIIDDYAWKVYYQGITLILDKIILKELRISDFGMLADEICIDEDIDVRKYLKAIAVLNIEDEIGLLNIVSLLEKYSYDIPIVHFETGKVIKPRGKIR